MTKDGLPYSYPKALFSTNGSFKVFSQSMNEQRDDFDFIQS